MKARDCLAQYRKVRPGADPLYAWPDKTAAAERHRTCASCTHRREADNLLYCGARRNCRGLPKRILFTVPRSSFDCPRGRWKC